MTEARPEVTLRMFQLTAYTLCMLLPPEGDVTFNLMVSMRDALMEPEGCAEFNLAENVQVYTGTLSNSPSGRTLQCIKGTTVW